MPPLAISIHKSRLNQYKCRPKNIISSIIDANLILLLKDYLFLILKLITFKITADINSQVHRDKHI